MKNTVNNTASFDLTNEFAQLESVEALGPRDFVEGVLAGAGLHALLVFCGGL
jgi:hypothetical protein